MTDNSQFTQLYLVQSRSEERKFAFFL